MSLHGGGEMGRGMSCGLEYRPECHILCPKVLLTRQSGSLTFHSVSISLVLVEVSLCSTSLSGQALVATDKHEQGG